MSELIAAAERIRAARKAAAEMDGGYPATASGRLQSAVDHCLLAEDWLAERDETPIDAEWFQTVRERIPRDSFVVAYKSPYGEAAHIVEDDDSVIECRTRGQLLTALRLLGVR